MENQHRLITGFGDMTQEEITLMNRIKEQGVMLGALVHELEVMHFTDHRWVSIGKTHLQQGIMALVRSVAQPTSF